MLKIARQKSGLSQRRLAKKLKVTQSYISKLENGSLDNVTLKLVLDISKELKLCPIDVFIFFSGNCSECHFNCHFCDKK